MVICREFPVLGGSRGNRGEFKFGAMFPDVSSENIIEKVWKSCFLTPEY